MKFLGHQNERFVFEMSTEEKSLLLSIVKLFPLSPVAHPRRQVSRKVDTDESRENQRLLEDALKAQREQSRQWAASLQKSRRFKPVEHGFELRFTRVEIEELLQILNDVRVGSWIAFGSPGVVTGMEFLESDPVTLYAELVRMLDDLQIFFVEAVSRTEL